MAKAAIQVSTIVTSYAQVIQEIVEKWPAAYQIMLYEQAEDRLHE
jgi:hypothetical protein